MVFGVRDVSRVTPIVTSRGELDDGNSLTMPVIKGRGARDPLSEITEIWVFKYAKSHSTTLEHVDGILPKGPYLPCLRMADRAILAGYSRCLLWICKLHLEVCCSLWHQSAIKSLWNSTSSARMGWCHAPAFVTHKITWHQAYLA